MLSIVSIIVINMDASDKKKQKSSFNVKERLKSFRYAFQGIITLFSYEHNARIHLFVLVCAVIAGILIGISGPEWISILFVTGLVFISECFNTAIEHVADAVTGERDERIGKAKDVAAAGVLISATVAVLTGLIIFIPGILRLIRGL